VTFLSGRATGDEVAARGAGQPGGWLAQHRRPPRAAGGGALRRKLWGTPLVVSTAVTAGVSYTVAQGAVGLNTHSQGVQVTWSESSNADDWSKNLIRARCEGRYATSVFAPLGVVVGDLTP
jgi:hypothetical protein